MVRISRSHRGGRGSIPRKGVHKKINYNHKIIINLKFFIITTIIIDINNVNRKI